MTRPDRWAWPVRGLLWVDIAWAIFAVANLLGMLVFATWETVPFHFIWVSLTILYGFRVWPLKPTLSVLGVIIAVTGAILIVDIARGTQPLDELTEVPLMSAMFLAMVWHARRRLVATEEMRRVSDENLRLLERERRFIQNASHELRTPITVAIGHAELLQRATDPGTMATDARVVLDELMRLRRLSERLLLLAAAEHPDFLHRRPIEIEPVLVEALHRWSPTPRQWRLGTTDEAMVEADADRLALAIDALVENAVKHTTPNDWIELSVRRNHGSRSRWPTRAPASRRKTWTTSSSALLAPMPAASATTPGSALASRSSRPSPRPTVGSSACAASLGREASSRSCWPKPASPAARARSSPMRRRTRPHSPTGWE